MSQACSAVRQTWLRSTFAVSRRSCRPCAIAVVVALLSLATGGCNIIGGLAAKTMRDPKIAAEYVPPPQQPMLVLVEDYAGDARLQAAADELSLQLTSALRAHQVAPVLDPERLAAVRSRDPRAYRALKIPDVGRAVGAKQILYVDLQECEVEEVLTGEAYRARYSATVKIVDVDSGATTYPASHENRPLSAATKYTRRSDEDTRESLRTAMLSDLGDRIACLFYRHDPRGDEQ